MINPLDPLAGRFQETEEGITGIEKDH